MTRMPTYFISHGGGPWPWMPDWRAMFKNLEASFVQMVKDLPERPKAILMISGHWEDASFAVMTSANPPMVYDYHGFPPETFQITYNAPGAPEIARRAAGLIAAAGLPVRLIVRDDPQQVAAAEAKRAVDAGAAAGAVTFDYQICEIAAPTNCAGGHRDRRASVATANAASRHRLRRVRYSLSDSHRPPPAVRPLDPALAFRASMQRKHIVPQGRRDSQSAGLAQEQRLAQNRGLVHVPGFPCRTVVALP